MQKIDLNDLLNKYHQEKCTPEELALLETWYAQSRPEDLDIDDHKMYKAREEVWTAVASKLFYIRHILLWPKIAAAAMLLLALSAGLFFYFKKPGPVDKSDFVQDRFKDNDIAPGGNKAYLTLANGKRIALTGAANGQLAKEAGVKIRKNADGELVYEVFGAKEGKSVALNAIETPRGGQYQVLLPDGTKVWLNAASKLTYPVSFSGSAERKVELTGEAYFEVVKDAAHPFKVKSAAQEIEVLGTHFNINSYKDEAVVKTTLIEGAVRVSRLGRRSSADVIVLRPGQQSAVAENGIVVNEVNIEDAVAWKNGNLIFNDEDLQSILREVARWYDIEIVYKEQPDAISLIGKVSRSKHLSAVLAALEQTGKVHFKVEGRRVTVMK